METQCQVNNNKLLRCKEMVLQKALIAYHNIEFIKVTVNETMFC
jgi:hypothetical protein